MKLTQAAVRIGVALSVLGPAVMAVFFYFSPHAAAWVSP